MEKRFAQFISILFHPIFIPLYTTVILLNLNSYFAMLIPIKGKLVLTGIILLSTVILPILTCYFMFRRKMIRSFALESKEERVFVLLNVAIYYFLAYYLLRGIHVSPVFSYYMIGLTFLVIISLILSFFHRTSLYMVGSGGVLGALLGLSISHSLDLMRSILTMILITGVIGTCRLITNSHKPSEIYSGWLIGVVIMFLMFYMV